MEVQSETQVLNWKNNKKIIDILVVGENNCRKLVLQELKMQLSSFLNQSTWNACYKVRAIWFQLYFVKL